MQNPRCEGCAKAVHKSCERELPSVVVWDVVLVGLVEISLFMHMHSSKEA